MYTCVQSIIFAKVGTTYIGHCVEFDLGAPAALPILLYSHLPKHNLVDSVRTIFMKKMVSFYRRMCSGYSLGNGGDCPDGYDGESCGKMYTQYGL